MATSLPIGNQKKKLLGQQIDQLLLKIHQSSGGKIVLFNLFPSDIWSKISLFAPGEFFALCEDFHLPYHYALFIEISSFRLFNILNYGKLQCFSSSIWFTPSKLSPKLQIVRMDNYGGNLEAFRDCLYLQEISMSHFTGNQNNGLEPLRGCRNLRVIQMPKFTGNLEPLSKGNLREIAINDFTGKFPEELKEKLYSLSLNNFNGELNLISGCQNLRIISMNSFIGGIKSRQEADITTNQINGLEPLIELKNLHTLQMNNFMGNWQESLEPLERCQSLRVLIMERFIGSGINSLQPLKGCQKLEVVVLNKFQGNLEPLRVMKKLRYINTAHFQGNFQELISSLDERQSTCSG